MNCNCFSTLLPVEENVNRSEHLSLIHRLFILPNLLPKRTRRRPDIQPIFFSAEFHSSTRGLEIHSRRSKWRNSENELYRLVSSRDAIQIFHQATWKERNWAPRQKVVCGIFPPGSADYWGPFAKWKSAEQQNESVRMQQATWKRACRVGIFSSQLDVKKIETEKIWAHNFFL